MHIFRTLPPGSHQPGDSELRRCLTAFDLIFLGIGAIIGTGIFVLTGIAAATQAGPAVVLSFVIAGLTCGLAALAYAELAAGVGGAGSAYSYSYVAFGEVVAWIIGWDLILEYGVATAAVANGWSGYFNTALSAVGLGLPASLTSAPAAGGLFNLPAAAIVAILALLLAAGAKQSSRANAFMVFVKLLTIAVFIGVAAFHIDPAHWHPFAPFGWAGTGADGKPVGILAGAAIVFFAYIGFDAVSTAVEEARDPQRDAPIGIVGSLLVCTLIYIAVSGLLTGIVPYSQLNVSSPVAHALHLIGVEWASALVAAGVIAGLTTVMLVLYYGLTRVIFAMSRDGLLPPFFARVSDRTRSPVRVIAACGIIIGSTAGLVPLGELAELVNIGTLAAFVLVCLGVVTLRVTHRDLHRPFRTPLSPWLPLLGAASCALLMVNLPAITWIRFGLWLLIGLVIYFAYSLRHSRLATSQS